MTKTTLVASFVMMAAFSQAASYEITPHQDARLQKAIPRTYAKLQKRAPVHAVAIGDSVMNMYGYDADAGNVLKAWSGVLLEELGDQFSYTGGVRLVKPAKGQPEKLHPISGPEITLQNFSRGGKLALHALQPLGTVAFENKPDLVIISYGINDANSGADVASYRRNVQDIIDLVRAQGADLILCGPSLTLSEQPESGLAVTPPFADVMREVAETNGVFFVDLGDLAWLVKLDERNRQTRIPKKVEAPAPDAKTAEVKPAVKVIQNPVADDADLDPDKKAVKIFQQIVQSLKLNYDHGATIDWVHPNTAAQRALGRRVYAELLNGPKSAPWKISQASVQFENPSQGVLTYRIENTTATDQIVTLLPLITGDWIPQDAPTRIDLKAGKKGDVKITYKAAHEAGAAGAASADLFSIHDSFLRLPILTVGTELARIEIVRSVITPVAVVWDTVTKFNQSAVSELEGHLINNSDQPVTGKWEASWLGQNVSAEFKIEPHVDSPFKVSLKMPEATTPAPRQKGTLNFIVNAGNKTVRFDRELEIVRNFGLKEALPLLAIESYVRDQVPKPPLPNPTVPGVAFKADADAESLYLSWDIFGQNLQDNPAGTGAMIAEVNLDARSYGKRQNPGSTDPLRVVVGAADGDAKLASLPPWCFGNGYGMFYDVKMVKCKLSSRPDGSRRLTLTLPRSYLYLHEWSLQNGNSQLGINTSLQIWQNAADNTGSYHTYVLTNNGRHRDDAESLAVLELTNKSTGRWTVRLY
ncbi:hypothetical protein BH11VER1_BH11VER1_25860 [soil metagenome]